MSSLLPRLSAVASDRASSACRIVLETAGIVRDWLAAGDGASLLDGPALEAELEAWVEAQAWRGPCALWLDSLRQAHSLATPGDPGRAGRELAEEMELWTLADERDAQGELLERATREPVAAGRRLQSRVDLARRAALEIEAGDTILVTAWSETVALSLETAWRGGRRPRVFLGEGSPGLDGRRMARRLARSGIEVAMAYDSAVLALVPRVDQVWLSTEAIGAGLFLARTGTRSLLEECSRRDVPVRVLATSDKLMPGGAVVLPAWAERESWLLWEDAPEGVRLESQVFEIVPIGLLELVGGFLTEIGRESAASLHLRALRVSTAPPCGAASPDSHRARAVTL